MKFFWLAVALALLPAPALALTDEIQVYTGDIVAAPAMFGLTWHNNYTPDGLKTPDFPGGLVDNHAYSSVTEWAYGVDALVRGRALSAALCRLLQPGWPHNGFKLRALFVQPDNATRNFYYGVNFEFSWNSRQLGREAQYRRDPAHHRLAFSRPGLELHLQSHPGQQLQGLLAAGFRAGDAAGFRDRPRAGPSRPRNMTISASCAASCRRTSSHTSSVPWWIMIWGRCRWNSAPASV